MASSRPQLAVSLRGSLRGPAIWIGGFFVILAAIFAWLLLPGHPPNPYTLLLGYTVDLTKRAQSYREDNGRYPASVEEWRTLQVDGRPVMDRVLECAERVGCPLPAVMVPPGTATNVAEPILVMRGTSGRIVIYGDGRVGLSRCLLDGWSPTPPSRIVVFPD